VHGPPHTGAVTAGFLDHPRPVAFAHRGGAGPFPENSWRAFEHAVQLGYAYLETDAHATADGQVVAFHDKTLDRVTDMTGRIAELPWAQVSRARIGGTEPENRGSQRLLAAAAKGELHDRALWTPLAQATGAAGNSTALVGTPETVAQALLDYIDIGVTTILIRGYDPYDDAIDYGRFLLPLVREEVARRDAEKQAVSA